MNISSLESIVKNSPYYSLGQLDLAVKMKAESHPGFMQQAQKTALFFPNVLWYQLLLDSIDQVTNTNTDLGSSTEHTNERLAALANEQFALFSQTVEEGTQLEIKAEALHTIDYFASLGINLEDITSSDDAFVTRVKRFTDWLKHMKSVNQEDLVADEAVEKAIRHIAASSNITEDVVTETMAQAYVQQGKINKAVQIYSKLSFLNPEKSAYFATKIIELKDQKK